MSGVPLKAMCSIMCASPVSLRGSCAEPASTSVKNENTGASGRRQRTIVSPLDRVFTETRFSYDDRSCAASGKAAASRSRQVNLANQRFIVPPKQDLSCIRLESYAGTDVQVKRMKAEAESASRQNRGPKTRKPSHPAGLIEIQSSFSFSTVSTLYHTEEGFVRSLSTLFSACFLLL